ncbi:MAG TPA: hypothetical protein PK816_04245 [Candidatus Cloacimonadota bacterium]|nr:hypothetical protein [Candidatus Cloacimonadota bacterium]
MRTLWVEDSSDLLSVDAILRYFGNLLSEQEAETLNVLSDQNTHFVKIKRYLENDLSNPIHIASDLSNAYKMIFENDIIFDLIVLDVKFPSGSDLSRIEKIKLKVFNRYEENDTKDINNPDFINFIDKVFTDDTNGIILFDLICEKYREFKNENELKQMICFFSGNDEDCVKFDQRLKLLNKDKMFGVRENMKFGKDLFYKKSNDSLFLEFVNSVTGRYSARLSSFFKSGLLHEITHGKVITDKDVIAIKNMPFFGFLSQASCNTFNRFFAKQIDNEDFKNQFRLVKLLEKDIFSFLSDNDYDKLYLDTANNYIELDLIHNIINSTISNIKKYSQIEKINQDIVKIFNSSDTDIRYKSLNICFEYCDSEIKWENFINGKTIKLYQKFNKYGDIFIYNNGKKYNVKSSKLDSCDYFENQTKIEIILYLC